MGALLISVQQDLNTLGIKHLHQYLLANGQDSHLLFMPTAGRDGDRLHAGLARFIGETRPKLVALSLMSHELADATAVTRFIRGSFPGIPVVWGGIQPTSDPEACFDVVDHLCVGEGERTMLDLARAAEQGAPFDDIPNIARRVNGKCVQNDLYPLIEDLDTLPLLRRIPPESHVALRGGVAPLTDKLFRRYARQGGRTYDIISSRGCPFDCAYCCNNRFHRLYKNWGVRRRSVGHIIGELEQVLADFPGMEYINFQDDCFLICTVKFLTEFCHAYRERVGVPFIARTTPSSITDERLGLLKDAGLAWINMALQSGSERICQDIYNRRSLPKHFVEAARVIHRHKIAAFYDVIMDNPWETEQDQLDSVRVLIDTPKPFFTQLFSLTFYSGTAVRERAEKECPGAIEDPTAKNYRVLRRRPVNDLVEIATTMHAPVMRWLVRRYEQSPGSAGTRLAILLAKWYSRALLAPLTVLREIRMSKGGSWTKTLRVLPSYFGMALTYYRTLFQSLFLGR